MTYAEGSGGAAPPARLQPSLHLLEEVVGRDPEPEERETQDGRAAEGDLVLPQRVRHHRVRPRVGDAVDLDDQPEVVPAHVEVVAAVPALADRLAIRRRQATTPTLASEGQLAERADAAEEVGDDRVHQRAPSVP